MPPPTPRTFHFTFYIHPTHLESILEGVLHIFFFHRLLGNARPGSSEILRTTVPVFRSSVVLDYIRDVISSFASSRSRDGRLVFLLFPSGGDVTIRSHLSPPTESNASRPVSSALEWISSVALQQTQTDSSSLTSSSKRQIDPPWEQWIVDLFPRGREPDARLLDDATRQLSLFALRAIQFSSESAAYMPAITNSQLSPFGIEIRLLRHDEGAERRPVPERRPSYSRALDLEVLENHIGVGLYD